MFGEGQFNQPSGVSVTKRGVIVVVQRLNHCVELFDERGHFLFQFGGCGEGALQFNRPVGVVVGSGGSLFVADTRNHRVQEVGVRSVEWSVKSHGLFGEEVGKRVEGVLMMWRREGDQENVMGWLPLEVVHLVVRQLVEDDSLQWW